LRRNAESLGQFANVEVSQICHIGVEFRQQIG
jgi:hypothetical protein